MEPQAEVRNFKFTRQLVFAAPTRTGDFTTIMWIRTKGCELFGSCGEGCAELNNISFKYISNTIAPARSAGNVILVHDTINLAKGRARHGSTAPAPAVCAVRRISPMIIPAPIRDGLQTTDAFGGFNGATDRYDWTYIGRQETYMPANNYRLAQRELQYKDIFTARPAHESGFAALRIAARACFRGQCAP